MEENRVVAWGTMNQLTLEWTEVDQIRTQTVLEGQPSKNPGTVRIGRDQGQCDLVLTDPTVSGLHAELFFNPQLQEFRVRNLRESNPPVVDGQLLKQGEEAPLRAGSQIYLGQMELKVVSVSLAAASFPATVLLPPLEKAVAPQSSIAPLEYGLKCSRCGRISPYSQLELGCPWCGISLAAAVSVLMPP